MSEHPTTDIRETCTYIKLYDSGFEMKKTRKTYLPNTNRKTCDKKHGALDSTYQRTGLTDISGRIDLPA